MLMGALMGKKYDRRKYINVAMIVMGVALFMGGGDKRKKHASDEDVVVAAAAQEDDSESYKQFIGIALLFVSLCFDGATGAYEDKLMSVHSVQPFDLMYNIQLGKTILAGVSLLVLNQLHIFVQMCQDMGFLLVALGLSGALGQVFIFITIAKFGALTCSIIGLARKVTTLVASIWFYGHHLNGVQFTGLTVSVASMVMNFMGKKGKKKKGGHGDGDGSHGDGGHGSKPEAPPHLSEEMQNMLNEPEGRWVGDSEKAEGKKGKGTIGGEIELATATIV
jgi:solute carrier family 35 (UDP-galactose transporter), member B1